MTSGHCRRQSRGDLPFRRCRRCLLTPHSSPLASFASPPPTFAACLANLLPFRATPPTYDRPRNAPRLSQLPRELALWTSAWRIYEIFGIEQRTDVNAHRS